MIDVNSEEFHLSEESSSSSHAINHSLKIQGVDEEAFDLLHAAGTSASTSSNSDRHSIRMGRLCEGTAASSSPKSKTQQKRKTPRTEFKETPTERLMGEQLSISRELAGYLKDIRDAMKDRNVIERAKLSIMEKQSPLMIVDNAIPDDKK
jgi:hypothetical protein